jgi:hypothetical protein
VDFLRKRLPAQVGRYLEGVEFPARKEELLGRLERNASCATGSRKASTAAPRRSCRPCEGGVSRLPASAAASGSSFSTGEPPRSPYRRSSGN